MSFYMHCISLICCRHSRDTYAYITVIHFTLYSETSEGAEGRAEVEVEVKVEPGVDYQPISIRVGPGDYEYECPLCHDVRASKNGMRGHIREVHTKIPYMCETCNFSTFNPDSLGRHEKKCAKKLLVTPRKR